MSHPLEDVVCAFDTPRPALQDLAIKLAVLRCYIRHRGLHLSDGRKHRNFWPNLEDLEPVALAKGPCNPRPHTARGLPSGDIQLEPELSSALLGSPRSGPRSGSGSGSGLRSGPRSRLRSDLSPRSVPRFPLRSCAPAPATPPELRFRIPRGL
ncbi:hypothetical protein B0H15DRAFT_973676 [Mycena belliarum]|uniref:Uncharacterized protein n=1 Tax=Mycena belliarum TaxID=1033014 RepID=A0AAD6TKS5_9AGAR|nr:hypothetical protein B0H15DRAFT_973676 [Mycena belliae]